jgi:hypothetical protein
MALFALVVTLVPPASLQPPATHAQGASLPYRVALPLVATGGTAPIDDEVGGPTSDELIARALAAGKLDAETALVYQVFAAYADPRLPAAYRGKDGPIAAPLAPELLDERFATLSPANKALLAPFRMLPTDEGSWYELQAAAQPELLPAGEVSSAAARITWQSYGEPGLPYKVWYQTRFPADETRARIVFAELKRLIWNKLTDLMGRGPLDDAALPNNGGDGRFDIYLVNANTVASYPAAGCGPTSTYMLVNRNSSRVDYVAVMLMDAILRGYQVQSCADYRWLRLATSFWAGHFVYPDSQIEQPWAQRFLSNTDRPLEEQHSDEPLGPLTPVLATTPEAYLLPFFMQHRLGDPGLIRMAWELAAGTDSVNALNTALPGGFTLQWPVFVLSNWNRGPVDDYQRVDKLRAGAAPIYDDSLTLNGKATGERTLGSEVNHLAAYYFRFTITDPAIRALAFENPFAEDERAVNANAHIQALVKIGGQWKPAADWTTRSRTTFCRDRAEERVEELVIIISNSEWRDRNNALAPNTLPRLTYTSIGCHSYSGTFSYVRQTTIPGDTGTYSATAQVTLMAPPPSTSDEVRFLSYTPTQATGSADLDKTFAGCRQRSGVTPIMAVRGSFELDPFAVDGPTGLTLEGSLGTSVPALVLTICNGVPAPMNVDIGDILWGADEESGVRFVPQPDGRIKGTFTRAIGTIGTETFTWDLMPAPE